MAEFENVRLYEPKKRMPHIVAIGGGHGLSAMLRGLKRYTKFITAIVTVADDGGGSGMLREDLGMLPPGDIRNCIMSLANTEPTMQKLLNYRFTEGSLAGQSFGNLFLAAMNGISGSFDEAVHRMGDVLAITGRVLPVTNQDVRLEAEFHDGSRVLGESKIFYAKKINNSRIRKVRLVPERPAALPESVQAIRDADIVVIGPGSLYTSVIPNFLVSGISDAVRVCACTAHLRTGACDGSRCAQGEPRVPCAVPCGLSCRGLSARLCGVRIRKAFAQIKSPLMPARYQGGLSVFYFCLFDREYQWMVLITADFMQNTALSAPKNVWV